MKNYPIRDCHVTSFLAMTEQEKIQIPLTPFAKGGTFSLATRWEKELLIVIARPGFLRSWQSLESFFIICRIKELLNCGIGKDRILTSSGRRRRIPQYDIVGRRYCHVAQDTPRNEGAVKNQIPIIPFAKK